MKNGLFILAVAAVLLLAFGCSQAQPPVPGSMPGSDRDEHGCIPSAGYSWCEPLQECIRPWETNCTAEAAAKAGADMMPGSDRDSHGCIPSAGYTWCEPKQKCLRNWEESCGAAPAKSDVRLITENFPPFNFEGKDGTAKGKSSAVVRGILSRLGQTADIEVLPWSQGYTLALNTTNVGLFSAARTLAREPLFKWVGPIGAFEKSLYARANSTLQINSLDSARSAGSICVVSDDVRAQMLTERGFTNMVFSPTDEGCVRDLAAGKVELWFGSPDSAPFTAYMAGVGEDSMKMAYSVERNEIYIAFSNSTPDATVEAWQDALDSMKRDGFYDALMGQYAVVAPDSGGREIAEAGPLILVQFQEKADGKLDAIISDLQSAADTNAARSGDWPKISPSLQALSGKHNYTLFWYALPNGTYYTVPAGLAAGNLASRSYFAGVMAGVASAGTLVASKSTGKNSAIVAVPIKKGTEVAGMLGSSTYLDSFSGDVAATLDLPAYMYFLAVDDEGQVALHSDQTKIMQYPATFGSQSVADAMETITSGGNGTLDYDYGGRLRRAVYATSGPAGWHYAIAEYLE
jgi:ABC-type amino acid transport substrate-binding protein